MFHLFKLHAVLSTLSCSFYQTEIHMIGMITIHHIQWDSPSRWLDSWLPAATAATAARTPLSRRRSLRSCGDGCHPWWVTGNQSDEAFDNSDPLIPRQQHHSEMLYHWHSGEPAAGDSVMSTQGLYGTVTVLSTAWWSTTQSRVASWTALFNSNPQWPLCGV